ncbi:MAG: hypothetical protein GY880_32680 [Planctomycetaceae bacterium]|nr:hypothetical protein [Planctomycetaceae bacterium]
MSSLMIRRMTRSLFCVGLLLTCASMSGCDGEKPVRIVDPSRLSSSTHQWCQVGNEDLTWRFDKSVVEISSGGDRLASEVVSDVLSLGGDALNALADHPWAPADLGVKAISASWELVDENRKIRLYDMEVDGDEFSGEIELPIMEAGDLYLDLGSQQYIIRKRN